MHNMTSIGARGALTRYEVIPVKGETSGKVIPVFRVFGQMNRRGKVAWLLWQERGVVNSVVVLGSNNAGLGV